MQRVSDILSFIGEAEIHILSLERFSLSRPNMFFYPTSSFLSLIWTLLRLRRINFDIFLGCNVDNIDFQFMLKLLKYKEFHSFDEGHIALRDPKWKPGQLAGIVYIEEFSFIGQKRWYFLNKLTGFPVAWGKIWDMADNHYTFYDPDIVKHPLSKRKEVTFVKRKNLEKKIESVFLGINSYWGWTDDGSNRNNRDLYDQALKRASNIINSLKPNLYLMHPREGEDLIKLLDEDIILLRNLDGNEIFLNSLQKGSQLRVYTVMSGAVYDLDTNIEIIYVNLFGRYPKDTYTSWIKEYNDFRKAKDPNSKEAIEIKFES